MKVFLKMFPMQIDWTGMEMNFVTLVYVSAIEVTGPSIVYLLPKHLLIFIQGGASG